MADEERPGPERPGEGAGERPGDRPGERPRYGELAPEGWSWPPAGSSGHAPAGRAPERPGGGGRRPVPGWDRPVTLLLLVVGILGMFLNIGIVTSAPQSMAALYASEGLGEYAMAGSVPGIMTAASIAQLAIFAATAAVSVVLVVRRRRAFYVPLLGGVVAAAANLAFMTAIVATDATLLQHYAGL